MAFNQPTSKLYESQYDNLVENTKNNPYMAYNKRASKNRAMNTNSKNTVGAINELLLAQQGLQQSVTAAVKKLNTVVGDHSSDKNLRDNFTKTGYPNITQGIIDLQQGQIDTVQQVKDLVKTITKDVVFIYPKLASNTVSVEQFVPYKGYITKIIARVSNVDNDRSSSAALVNLVLQHASNTAITFSNIQNIVIEQNENSVTYDLSEKPIPIDNEVLKCLVVKYPNSLTNLCVVATIIVDDTVTYDDTSDLECEFTSAVPAASV